VPTVVSFYSGAEYYHRAAATLIDDCIRLGLPHDIVHLEKPDELEWSDICRLKIPFYEYMLDKHPQGILWVDVDTRILRPPLHVFGSAQAEGAQLGYDFGAFPRNFKSFREFDPALFGRRFHPGFLHFTGTKRCRDFADHLASVERTSTANGTDDFFLEEAFRSFEPGLGIHLFSHDLVAFSEDEADRNPRAIFLHGASGNVGAFIDKVEQHHAEAFTIGRDRATLIRHFRMAVKRARRDEAEAILRAALRLDPAHKDTALIAADFFQRVNKPKSTLQCLRGAFDMRTAPPEAQVLAIEANLADDNLPAVELGLRRLARSGSHVDYHRSRAFRLDLEKRAQALGLTPEQRPALWWMEQPYPGNLGDILNPYIVERLCGLPPRFVPKGDGILAIGSVIKFAREGTHVWGAGTPRMTDSLSPKASYHAVRGPLTRQLVLESGGHAPEIYGDPAMLMPLIRPAAQKRHRLGVIRHYTHASLPLQISGDVVEIGLDRVGYSDIEQFTDELTACEAIISTSLHGLIIAHAYGIPTRRAVFSAADKQIPGDGTKFSDHYAAFGIVETEPLDLSLSPVVTDATADLCCEVVTSPLQALALLDAAPFAVLDDMRRKAVQWDEAQEKAYQPPLRRSRN
jgi:hypothetical protein